MKIYALTPIGHRLARSVSSPEGKPYRIVYYLDQIGQSTIEQIAEYCGASTGETSAILGGLRRKGIVKEISEATV